MKGNGCACGLKVVDGHPVNEPQEVDMPQKPDQCNVEGPNEGGVDSEPWYEIASRLVKEPSVAADGKVPPKHRSRIGDQMRDALNWAADKEKKYMEKQTEEREEMLKRANNHLWCVSTGLLYKPDPDEDETKRSQREAAKKKKKKRENGGPGSERV